MDEQPLFLVGVGRSGSSFMARILSRHPDVGFLTGVAERFPDRPRRNRRVLRLMEMPLLGRLVRRRYGISEAYRFWEHAARGFSEPMRDLRADDVTPFAQRQILRSLEKALPASRERFFAKITGWSRMAYLNEIFPAARFVHLVRDGRDVANSLLRVWFWWGWRGPENWRFGPLSTEHERLWDEHDRSFVVLAGLAWKILVGSVEEARHALSEVRFHQVRYEDFLAAPIDEIRRIADFADLGWDRRLERAVEDATFRDPSGRHRQDLTEDQVERLTSVLEPELRRYGYL